MDLALNNLQWLIYHKTEPNQTKQSNNKESKSSKRGLLFIVKLKMNEIIFSEV